MGENQKQPQDQALEELKIKVSQEKLTPKFCTNITVGLLKNNKNLVFTMAYSEGKESAALIERIVIDLDHAKSLNEVLTKVIKEADNASSSNSN